MARFKLKLFDNIPPDEAFQDPPKTPERPPDPEPINAAGQAEIRKDKVKRRLRKATRQEAISQTTARKRRKDEQEAKKFRKGRG